MTLPKRFSVYDNFIYYDINDPLGNDVKKLEPNSFDFILADPPFWLEEVLLKLFQTIDHLKTHNGKTMICAGPPMTSFLVSSSGSGLSGPRRSRKIWQKLGRPRRLQRRERGLRRSRMARTSTS